MCLSNCLGAQHSSLACASHRSFQERCTGAERELEAARRALREEKERGLQLQEKAGRLEAALAEARTAQAAGERKLWCAGVPALRACFLPFCRTALLGCSATPAAGERQEKRQ